MCTQTLNFSDTECPDGQFLAGLSDEELIALFRTASSSLLGADAFKVLFQRYHGRIVVWCRRFTRDSESARDVAQEVFFKVFKHVTGFRGDSKFSTWLYVIARNQCAEVVRKRATEAMEMNAPIPASFPDNKHLDIHASIERSQTFQSLWRIVDQSVNALEAEVMRLHYGEEMQLDAITRRLNLRNGSGAKAYIVSARRKLDRAMRSETQLR